MLVSAIAGTAAIVASFLFLTDFAKATGWPDDWAPLLPLCLDALGAAALLFYGFLHDKFAGAVAVGAIVASMAGNAAAHGFAGGWLEPSWLAYTLSGFVPAITIGLIIHLLSTKGAELWATLATSPAVPTPSTTPGTSPGEDEPSDASSTGTNGSKSRKAANTTGAANTATPWDGGDLDWEDFTTWPRHKLQQRTFDQLMAWTRTHGMTEHPTGPQLIAALRCSKRTASRIQHQLASEAPSNDSTSPEPSALVTTNGHH